MLDRFPLRKHLPRKFDRVRSRIILSSQAYEAKLAELKAVGDPIVERHKEHEQRTVRAY